MNLTRSKVITGHAGAIYDVLVADSKCFTTSADKFVARWDLKSGEQDGFSIKVEHSGYRIAANPDFHLLAVGNSRGGIHVVDLQKKSELRYMTQHQSPVFALTFNPYTNQFYSGDADGYFCVWDGESFDLLVTLPFNCGKIRNIAFDSKGEWLVFGGQDGMAYLLDSTFFNLHKSWKTHKDGMNCACFFGEELITGGKDAYIRKWDLKSGKLITEIPAHNYAVYDLMLMQNDNFLVSCSFDKTIKVWNPKDLSIFQRIERKEGGHTHTVNRLAKVSEQQFLSVSDDRQILLWEF